MPKMKVVDFDELYNCLVDDFLIWNHLVFENAVWSYLALTSKLGPPASEPSPSRRQAKYPPTLSRY